MKLFYYKFMRYICWKLEDIHDLFCKDHYDYYPSSKWEDKMIIELGKDVD